MAPPCPARLPARPRPRGPRGRDAGLHRRLQGRPAGRRLRRPDLPRGRAGARRTSSTRPTRSASSSTSTASSTSRRSTRAGSASSRSRTATATRAVSAGPDEKRPGEEGDTGDGRDIQVDQDHRPPGRPTRARRRSSSRCRSTATSAAASRAACARPRTSRWPRQDGGKLADGIDNYDSSTGRKPAFHEHEVARRARARRPSTSSTSTSTAGRMGDLWNPPPPTHVHPRQLDRHRPQPPDADGRPHQPGRNPLQESEASYGTQLHARGRRRWAAAARWPTAPTSTASSTRRPTWTSCTRPASSTRSTTAA